MAVLTAEPTTRPRSASLEERSAVPRAPEKDEKKVNEGEKYEASEAPVPNKRPDFAMAGNGEAQPEPLNGNATSPPMQSAQSVSPSVKPKEEEQEKEVTPEGEAVQKKMEGAADGTDGTAGGEEGQGPPADGAGPGGEAGDEAPSKSGEKAKAEEGGESGRLTDMVDPSKDGGEERMKAKVESEKGMVTAQLQKDSEKAMKRATYRVKGLRKNEKKKETAEEKLEHAKGAVVETPGDKEAEAETAQAQKLDAAPKPDVQAAETKRELRNKYNDVLPDKIKELVNFANSSEVDEIGDTVDQMVKKQTTSVESTYEQVHQAPPPQQPKESIPLEENEKAVETPPMALGEGLLPEVNKELTDLTANQDESDQLLEKEGIKQEYIDLVDSGPLYEAGKQRGELKEAVEQAPQEMDAFEQERQDKLKKKALEQEKDTKDKTRQQREGRLTEAKDKQKKTKSKLELQKEEVTNNIKKRSNEAKTKVDEELKKLETRSKKHFQNEKQGALAVLNDTLDRGISRIEDDRWSGITGGAYWAKDKLFGMDGLSVVKRLFTQAENAFTKSMDAAVDHIIKDTKETSSKCKVIIANARKGIDKFVSELDPKLQKTGEDAQREMERKLNKLDEEINTRTTKLINDTKNERKKAQEEMQKLVEEKKASISGLLAALGRLLLDAMMKLFKWALEKAGYKPDEIMGIIEKGKAVITAIVTDPIGFIGNLISAVKGGIDNFRDNIETHMVGGLIKWLTGQLDDLPIRLPDTFDLQGILGVILQILGLTWDSLRSRLVERVGEPVVEAAEKGVDIVQRLVSEGPMALWEMVKEKAEEIKETVISGIRNWVIVQVVKQGIIGLATFLNPAGAIVQAILAIYNTVMFFVENWDRIKNFVNSIFDSIGEIAMGKIGAAAKYIEDAMAQAIPLILNFLARLLKIGGISKAIQGIVKKLRGPVDKVVNKTLKFIEKKARKLFGGGKKGEKPKKGAAKKIKEDNKKGKPQKITAKDKKKHKKIADKIAAKLNTPAKKDEKFEDFHKRKKAEASKLEDKYQPQLKKGINLDIKFRSAQKDKEDGDVDMKLKIAPNDELQSISADAEDAVGSKVSASVILPTDVKSYSGNKKVSITEKRKGKEKVGYKASTTKDEKKANSVVVGEAGSDNKYIKTRRKEKDYDKEHQKLMGMSSPATRRDHIKKSGETQTNEEKIEIYNSVYKAAKMDFRIQVKGELTDSEVGKHRRKMVADVAGHYVGKRKLKKLDEEILHGKLTGKVGNKILGEIFETWVEKNVGGVKSIEVIFEDDDGTVLRKADGYVSGSTLVEMKSVGSAPAREEKDQMDAYKAIILKQTKGYLAGSGKTGKKPYNAVRYVFSNLEAAEKWESEIHKRLKGVQHSIYVGDEKLDDIRADD